MGFVCCGGGGGGGVDEEMSILAKLLAMRFCVVNPLCYAVLGAHVAVVAFGGVVVLCHGVGLRFRTVFLFFVFVLWGTLHSSNQIYI